MIVASAKTAFTVGAILGGTVALATNDRFLEFTANLLQHGADRLHEHIRNKKMAAAPVSGLGDPGPWSQSEMTTPSATDDESETSAFCDDETSDDELYDVPANHSDTETLDGFERISNKSDGEFADSAKPGQNLSDWDSSWTAASDWARDAGTGSGEIRHRMNIDADVRHKMSLDADFGVQSLTSSDVD